MKIKMKMKNCAAALILLLSGIVPAATMVTSHLTADNAFDLFIGTDDFQYGTYVGSGTDWGTTYTYSFALQPGVTNYLHVCGVNWGGPASFIGDFTLSDSAFAFANGTQYLTTNAADWKVSASGFDYGYQTPSVWGGNGSGPWGYHSGIDAAAQWIWTDDFSGGMAYLTTPIYVVPEPVTIGFLVMGIAFLRKR